MINRHLLRCLRQLLALSEVAARLIEVRSVGDTGQDLLTLSYSHFDPTRTLAWASDLASRRASRSPISTKVRLKYSLFVLRPRLLSLLCCPRAAIVQQVLQQQALHVLSKNGCRLWRTRQWRRSNSAMATIFW